MVSWFGFGEKKIGAGVFALPASIFGTVPGVDAHGYQVEVEIVCAVRIPEVDVLRRSQRRAEWHYEC